MIDITRAGMTQHTLSDGTKTDWKVTLEKEELYTLSKDYTVQQMFEIRDVVAKMMHYAHKQGTDEANQLAGKKLADVILHGDAKLDALKEENERLALALEKHIISEEN